ncbi:MAG TPA: DUF2393 family protein [Candidatus Solibacter sp.]|jgi:hypothetical protein|nr:DUF2393 family protein [Candidatus Solibacter sp.]
MGDAEKNPPSQNAPFSAPEADRNGNTFGISLAMGVAFVALVIAAVTFFNHKSPNPNGHKTDPYAAKLQTSEWHMSVAENFAGNPVTYIEGKITNTGDKKVTGTTIELVFKNSLGETSQQELLPVMVLLFKEPYVDFGSLEQAPLAPGQTREFRLTLEHVTADWNRQLPQARVVAVSY